MFLIGLKFALGAIAVFNVVFGSIIGIVEIQERVSGGWKESKRASRRIVDRTEISIARQNNVLVMLRYPNWVGEPAECADRRIECLEIGSPHGESARDHICAS